MQRPRTRRHRLTRWRKLRRGTCSLISGVRWSDQIGPEFGLPEGDDGEPCEATQTGHEMWASRGEFCSRDRARSTRERRRRIGQNVAAGRPRKSLSSGRTTQARRYPAQAQCNAAPPPLREAAGRPLCGRVDWLVRRRRPACSFVPNRTLPLADASCSASVGCLLISHSLRRR
jgi:hypothetical protein